MRRLPSLTFSPKAERRSYSHRGPHGPLGQRAGNASPSPALRARPREAPWLGGSRDFLRMAAQVAVPWPGGPRVWPWSGDARPHVARLGKADGGQLTRPVNRPSQALTDARFNFVKKPNPTFLAISELEVGVTGAEVQRPGPLAAVEPHKRPPATITCRCL